MFPMLLKNYKTSEAKNLWKFDEQTLPPFCVPLKMQKDEKLNIQKR